MLLKALVENGSLRSNTVPVGYEKRTVKWIVPLTQCGSLCGEFEPTSGPVGHGRGGKRFLIPKRPTKPRFSARALVDNAMYALGISAENRKQDHTRSCQLSFLREAELCAQATGKSCVSAICVFLKHWMEERGPVPRHLVATDIITFRVDDIYPFTLPEVHDYCSRRYVSIISENADQEGVCMICSRWARRSKRLPFKLSRLPGAHAAGMSLVSIHRPAFESYWQKGTSGLPVCSVCGEAAARAANELLDDPQSHLVIGRVAYLFWAADPCTFDISSLLAQPRREEIKALLEGRSAGLSPDELEETKFHLAAVSANTGRIVIRDWFGSTTRQAMVNLQHFYRLQTAFAQQDGPLSVIALTCAAKDCFGATPVNVGNALLRCALTGTRPPSALLWHVLRLIRTCGISRARALLIHLCLFLGKEEMIEQAPTAPAYRCGQIIALLEEIQRRAVGETSASIADRFFGGASISPALVLPQLLRKAQAHLQKLRRQRPGAFQALDSQLQDSLRHVAEFPQCLSLNDQGLFALGYYHHKAASRAAMRERWRRKSETAPGDPNDLQNGREP